MQLHTRISMVAKQTWCWASQTMGDAEPCMYAVIPNGLQHSSVAMSSQPTMCEMRWSITAGDSGCSWWHCFTLLITTWCHHWPDSGPPAVSSDPQSRWAWRWGPTLSSGRVDEVVPNKVYTWSKRRRRSKLMMSSWWWWRHDCDLMRTAVPDPLAQSMPGSSRSF